MARCHRLKDGRVLTAMLILWLGLSGVVHAAAIHPKIGFYSKQPEAVKIHTSLLRLEYDMRTQQHATLQDAATAIGVESTAMGLSLDLVIAGITPARLAQLQLPGVTIVHVSPQYNRVAVRIDHTAVLYDLARLRWVQMILPEYGFVTNAGAVTSRAVQSMQADTAKATFAVDGTGETVGVLSDSFAQSAGMRDGDTAPAAGVAGALTGSLSQDSADLPATVDLRRDDFINGTDEGAAMAELIYDMAPGVALAFHTAFGGQTIFADGITDLCTAAGATVVVDDVLYFAEPMYQDGIIAQAAAACVEAGIPFFSSAGNNSNRGFRQRFVDLTAADDTATPPSGDDLHDWGGGDGFLDIAMPTGATVLVVLQWNQPFASISGANGAQIDLDLYLTPTADTAGLAAPLAGSAAFQGVTGSPAGDAIEIISYTNNGPPTTVYLAVEHFDGNQDVIPQEVSTPVEFRLVFFESGSRSVIQGIPSALSTHGGPTIYGHSMASGVVSVAAVPWFDTARFTPGFPPTADVDPEDFTALGGSLTIQFDTAGNFVPRTSFEPDLAAVDGNNTTFFGSSLSLSGAHNEPDGFPNFFGTSAAAPNAAAVAALLRQANGALTPLALTALLETTAVDIVGQRAAIGDDDVTGAGLVDAHAAFVLAQTNQVPDGLIDNPIGMVTIITGETVAFASTGTDPDGDTPLSFAWDFDGGAPNSGVEDPGAVAFATVGTYTVSLTVTDSRGAVDPTPATVVVTVVSNQFPNGVIDSPSDPVTIVAGETVTVASTGTDPDGDTPLSFAWNFDGGAPNSGVEDPGAVAFATAGTYTVSLTVTDSRGAVDPTPATVVITVVSNQPPNGVIDNLSGSLTIVVGESVTFRATGIDPDGHSPLSFAWDFGGGAPSSVVEDPGAVTFSTVGTYTVGLTVTDSQGAVDPTPATVVVIVRSRDTGANQQNAASSSGGGCTLDVGARPDMTLLGLLIGICVLLGWKRLWRPYGYHAY